MGADSTATTDLLAGLDSAQIGAGGWDAVVKGALVHSDVTRNSNSEVTIVLPAFAGYNITGPETVTATVPATALSSEASVVASPTWVLVSGEQHMSYSMVVCNHVWHKCSHVRAK